MSSFYTFTSSVLILYLFSILPHRPPYRSRGTAVPTNSYRLRVKRVVSRFTRQAQVNEEVANLRKAMDDHVCSLPQSNAYEVTERDEDDFATKTEISKRKKADLLRSRHKGDKAAMARHLVQVMFTEDEMCNSNCNGEKNKRALDPVRLAAIREVIFDIAPSAPSDEDFVWKNIKRNIDTSLRGKLRPSRSKKGKENAN